ncbi:MAG: hypothetical protein JKX72_00740 [Robiginitomaculum sp.]|nr:hypothetical protein [Robiginitomaculum sp.]
MMQDNFDDKMFKDLLNEYAAPMDDAGFSDAVMAGLMPPKPRKAYFVGIAAALGGGYAALQVPNLWRYISAINLPTLNIPKLDIPQIETASSMSPYTLVSGTLFMLIFIWLCSVFLLEDSM